MKTFDDYVCHPYGLDACPSATLILFFHQYYPGEKISVENLSAAHKINSVTYTSSGCVALMQLEMLRGNKIRFSINIGKNEFNQFRRVLLLLKEDYGNGFDVVKKCGNNISLLISKLSQLREGWLLFSKKAPGKMKRFIATDKSIAVVKHPKRKKADEENVAEDLKRTRKWFRTLTKKQKHTIYKESKKAFEKMGIVPKVKGK